MNPSFPTPPTVIFILTIVFIFIALLVGIKSCLAAARHSNQTGVIQVTAFLCAAFLIGTAFMAKKGIFNNLDSFPPRIAFVLIPLITLILFLAFNKRIGSLLEDVPYSWFIYPQIFRIAIEIVLWQLHDTNRYAPEQMTFEGLNFDILAGITAPIVAFICFGQGRNLKSIALVWNFLSLGLLINIVTISFLSFPSIGAFDQSNTFIAWFPFIWLPLFAVPFALLLHAMSIRQLLQKNHF